MKILRAFPMTVISHSLQGFFAGLTIIRKLAPKSVLEELQVRVYSPKIGDGHLITD